MVARLPPYVEAELRAFLRCGVLACGFGRARCVACGCPWPATRRCSPKVARIFFEAVRAHLRRKMAGADAEDEGARREIGAVTFVQHPALRADARTDPERA